MSKAIMIQGTMSNAGKSILAGGLCRVFAQDGYRVAPFKSQNMALNSYVTEEGLEMGRAQVMQAEAAGICPSVLMNPILLKPTNDTGSQVIVNGQVTGTMSATEYFRHKTDYIPDILYAYRKLEEQYDIIVIEGAGSPAEINLKENDIVNMGLAKMVNAPVILVGDIDRGGVFAQIVGTIELLEKEEQDRIIGSVINKFRGDKTILAPGLEMLTKLTKKPVLGVVPYFHLDLDEEDSLSERFNRKQTKAAVDIAVIRLPRISNFTDLMALECMDEVSVRYVSAPWEFGEPDAVILPGSKNTIGDLLWMRQNGLETKVIRHASQGKLVFGICGGYQMLGEKLSDPEGVESNLAGTWQDGKGTEKDFTGTDRHVDVRGMGLLPIRTTFSNVKTRTRVEGHFLNVEGILKDLSGVEVEGYEIHMGQSVRTGDAKPLLMYEKPGMAVFDGASAGNVYGCYLHGIFDKARVSQGFVRALMWEKGLDPSKVGALDMKAYKEQQYDKLAEIIRESLDMETIYLAMGIER